MTDHTCIKRTLELAAGGAGSVSPNPLVGTVLMKDGRVIGEGWHRSYGGKHAEAEAFDAAACSPRGATLYCNLEPCSHDGPGKHQPPCTDRIIRERISRVVIANVDPNPRVNGRGIARLREAGIEVVTGILAAEGAALNEAFFRHITSGHPFVTLKVAQSLDGRIATRSGHSKWITDAAARERVHRMRAACDALLVGAGTVRADDPELTVRHLPGRSPLRVILDGRLSIPPEARILSPDLAPGTLIVTSSHACPEKTARIADRGAELIRLPSDAGGRVDLRELLAELGRRRITSLLVEGGAELFTSFVRDRLFDKLLLFLSPMLIGEGTETLGNLGTERISDARRLCRIRTERIGDQLMLEGYREPLLLHDGIDSRDGTDLRDDIEEATKCLRV